MSDKEYTVIEIVDVLRRRADGDNISAIARSTRMDRKTVRKYIRSAEEKGLATETDVDIEAIAYAVFKEVNAGNAEDSNIRDSILLPHKESIAEWIERDRLTNYQVAYQATADRRQDKLQLSVSLCTGTHRKRQSRDCPHG